LKGKLQWNSLSQRRVCPMRFKSLYVWIGIPVIVAGVWFLIFYMPMRTESATSKRSSRRSRTRRKSGCRHQSTYEMKRKEESIKASLREYQGQIPLFDNFPDFIHSVAGGARRSGFHSTSSADIQDTRHATQDHSHLPRLRDCLKADS